MVSVERRGEASFARLALVCEEKRRRRADHAPPVADAADAADGDADATLEQEILGMALDMALDEKTGRSGEDWETWRSSNLQMS